MITISVLGLDQYVVGHYSKEHSANLANLFEIEESELDFYAPESVVFHKGVEQTSWNAIVVVRAPKRCQPVEGKVASYLMRTMSDFTINIQVEFEYFDEGTHYQRLNKAYPRFIEEKNIMDVQGSAGEGEDGMNDADEDDEEADPRDRADLNPDDPDQLYLGDVFQGREKQLDEAAAKKAKSLKKKS